MYHGGPTSILAGGYAGRSQRSTSSTLTEIGGHARSRRRGRWPATLPSGEIVCTALFGYSGTLHRHRHVSKGLRVGSFDQFYGTLQYGPLSIETHRSRCGRSPASDRFLLRRAPVARRLLVVHLAKVDLGTPVDQAGQVRLVAAPAPAGPGAGRVIRHVTVDDGGLLLFNVDGVGTVPPGPGRTVTPLARG
jgi:hypothetical protein